MSHASRKSLTDADRNWRRFVLFRVVFNSRFYYPVLAVLFLDLGLTATEYTLLNFAWALAIVFTDLPAGALADRIGRKPLVVAAAAFMVLEMILLGTAPRNGGLVLLLCCFGNRILSGMAEGMASGADEALVFDSLAERGRSDEWPKVLDQVMRWQAVGMVIAMLLGGAAYDPIFMTRFASFVGVDFHFTQDWTLRFPVSLTLVNSIAAFVLSITLREPKLKTRHAASESGNMIEAELSAWHLVTNAGSWTVKTPTALFVIVAGVLIDSAIRIFLTLSSSYYRIIELPEASFGIIGAVFGGLGLAF
jgi:MFS family permease